MSSQIFSILSVVLLVLGHPERLSSSTNTQLALKRECHSITAVRLKECFSKTIMKHLKGFGSRFTEIHAKLDVDMLLDFAIHRRQNETRSRKRTCVKTMCVHSMVSCGRVKQQACRSVTLAFPSHHLSPRLLQK
jgi:hypothetical protein